MKSSLEIPNCLVFSGHDPSGGAGIQADIETLASIGSHAVSVITALTVQDTINAYAVEPVSASLLIHQARTLLADIKPKSIKIGLIPDTSIAEAIHSILVDIPEVPVVLDPVIRASGGGELQAQECCDAINTLLLPLATVVTPNVREARVLARNADSVDACGISLLESGCDFVLITGGDTEDKQVNNKLYANNRCLETFVWPRLPHEYHGSGCTLASAIAGFLTHGNEPHSAIREAQQYTWDSLNHAYRTGKGQLQPNRFCRNH